MKETIKQQIDDEFRRNVAFVERIKEHLESWEGDTETIRKQLAYNKKRIPRDYKTDNIQYRISRKIREVAKLYHGIENYYMEEDLFTHYILNIIRQAIEEVENEKDNS